MKRYVDANALRKRAIRYPDNHYKVNIEDINNMPTADVQEVRHGHWITKSLDNFRKVGCKCSECGYTGISDYDSYDDPYDFDFCPHCGAKMDGGDE